MGLLLTAKQRRMSPQAQVQSLVRIGRRALANADHLEELLGDYYQRNGTEADRQEVAARIVAQRAKARRATEEMLAVAESTDDLDLRRRAKAARNFRGF